MIMISCALCRRQTAGWPHDDDSIYILLVLAREAVGGGALFPGAPHMQTTPTAATASRA